MTREELIRELYDIYWSSGEAISGMDAIADFILSREKQLLDGLRTARLNYAGDKVLFPLLVAIDKTFRDAGVEL